MAETCYLAESTICYPPLFNELRQLTPRPTHTTETVAMAAVAASLEQNAGAILVMSTSGNTARLISKFRPSCPIMTLTRNEVTARQIHLHRGCYPFYFNEPRPHSDEGWQTDVDNRIRYGLKQGLELGILKKGDTIIAVQGWRSGGNHTSEYTSPSDVLATPSSDIPFSQTPCGSSAYQKAKATTSSDLPHKYLVLSCSRSKLTRCLSKCSFESNSMEMCVFRATSTDRRFTHQSRQCRTNQQCGSGRSHTVIPSPPFSVPFQPFTLFSFE